jgi:hypothetical protein
MRALLHLEGTMSRLNRQVPGFEWVPVGQPRCKFFRPGSFAAHFY